MERGTEGGDQQAETAASPAQTTALTLCPIRCRSTSSSSLPPPLHHPPPHQLPLLTCPREIDEWVFAPRSCDAHEQRSPPPLSLDFLSPSTAAPHAYPTSFARLALPVPTPVPSPSLSPFPTPVSSPALSTVSPRHHFLRRPVSPATYNPSLADPGRLMHILLCGMGPNTIVQIISG